MAHYLATLLGKETADFEQLIRVVESTIDGEAIDVALIGELAQKAAALKRQLQLDPRDTTALELYQVLLARIRDDNARLATAIGGRHANAVSEMSPLIVRTVQSGCTGRECLVVKSTVLKRLFRDNPPTLTMQQLHYRSLASMLKHERAEAIMVLARYLEDEAWQQAHAAAMVSLQPADMTLRPPMVVWLDKAVLADALRPSIKRHHLVLHAKEAGIVALAPTGEKVIECFTVRTMALMTYYLQELVSLGTLGKLLITQPDFGARYTDALIRDHDNHVRVAGYPVHWRSMHHAMAVGEGQDVFAPHIAKRDWQYQPVNSAVSSHVPHELWDGLSGVLVPYEQPLSSNVIDLAVDASYRTLYGGHSLKYGRRELEHELLRRYLAHPRVREVILRRLRVI